MAKKNSNVELSDLAKLMEKVGIKVEATHLHVEFFDDKGNKLQHPRDKWYVLIEYHGKSFGTFYTAGIGHRLPALTMGGAVKHERGMWVSPLGDRVSTPEAIKRGWLTLPSEGPRTDYILQSLLSDAAGAEESFKDWCGSFGQNPDSISHLMVYLACQDTRDKLMRMFGPELLKSLNEAARGL